MAVIFGAESAPTILERAPFLYVYYKNRWSEETWTPVPYLQVDYFDFVAAPQISSARFTYHYGQIKREDMDVFAGFDPLWLVNKYCRISTLSPAEIPSADSNPNPTGSTGPEWFGIFSDPSDEVGGNNPETVPPSDREYMGKQSITAYGLEILLDRIHIQSARHFKKNPLYDPENPGTYGETYVVESDRLGTVNLRNDKGFSLIGNFGSRTLNPKFDDPLDYGYGYGFIHPDDGGDIATLEQYVDYLLEHDGPAYLNEDDEKVQMFFLAGNRNLLKAVTDPIEIKPMTVWQQLCRILDRRRNIGFKIITSGEPSQPVLVYTFPLSEKSFEFGGIFVPANEQQVIINPDNSRDIESFDVEQHNNLVYDSIIVRGNPVKVMASFGHWDGTLEKAWTDQEEQQYKNGLLGIDTNYSGYSAAEKTTKNDEFRAGDRFKRTGRLFRIPRTWNGIVKRGDGSDLFGNAPLSSEWDISKIPEYVACLKADSDGRIRDWRIVKDPVAMDRGFLPSLLVKEGEDYGVDYSILAANDGNPIDRNPEGSEPQFLKPFALVYNSEKNRYYFADKLQQSGLVNYLNAHITVNEREFGIEVDFGLPQYLLKSEFVGNEPTSFNPEIDLADDGGAYDWKRMIVTAAIEIDDRLQVVVNNTGANQSNPDINRQLVIDVPDAERWIIIQDTVLGIRENGQLIRHVPFGATVPGSTPSPLPDNYLPMGTVIRDDINRLRAVAAFLSQWHGSIRSSIRLTIKNLQTYCEVGSIVLTASGAGHQFQPVNTIVTKVSYSLGGGIPRTTIETSYQELDPLAMFGFDAPGIPGSRAAAQMIHSHTRDIRDIKQKMPITPSRIAASLIPPALLPEVKIVRLAGLYIGDTELVCFEQVIRDSGPPAVWETDYSSRYLVTAFPNYDTSYTGPAGQNHTDDLYYLYHPFRGPGDHYGTDGSALEDPQQSGVFNYFLSASADFWRGSETISTPTAAYDNRSARAGMFLDILSGTNAGSYEIESVQSDSVLKLVTAMLGADTEMTYRIRIVDNDAPVLYLKKIGDNWIAEPSVHSIPVRIQKSVARTEDTDADDDSSVLLTDTEPVTTGLYFTTFGKHLQCRRIKRLGGSGSSGTNDTNVFLQVAPWFGLEAESFKVGLDVGGNQIYAGTTDQPILMATLINGRWRLNWLIGENVVAEPAAEEICT